VILPRLAATGLTATALLLLAGTPASAAPGQPLYCTNNNFNGIVALDCHTPTPEHPANQNCDRLERADNPQAAQLLGSLGLQVPSDTMVGITCAPISAQT
jgi:hypothetical protein